MYKRIRLIIYPLFTILLLWMYSGHKRQVPGDIEITWQWIFTLVFAGLLLCLFVYDILYFSLRRKTQPCIACGYEREMRPFRIYGRCPGCGG